MDSAVYNATQPCKITVSVFVEVNYNPERKYTLMLYPLPQPTTTTIVTTTTSAKHACIPPSGKLLWSIQLIGMYSGSEQS